MRLLRTVPKRQSIYVIASFSVLTALAAGCQLEPTGLAREDPPFVDPIILSWVTPAENDSVAGMVALRAEATGGGGLRRMVFYADGIPIDSCTSPPWEGSWTPQPVASTRRATLRADVWDEGGFRFRSPDQTIWQVPDAPPAVHLRGLESIGAAPSTVLATIEVYGCDPEDGPLGEESLEWEVEGMPIRVRASAFDITQIGPWPQRLRAWGRDRRGQTAQTPWILSYEFVEAGTPSALFENLAFSFASADTSRFFASLSPDFRFFPCSDDLPWSRRKFRQALTEWYERGNRPLRWDWRPRRPSESARLGLPSSGRGNPTSDGWYVASNILVEMTRVPDDECSSLPPVVTAGFAANIHVSEVAGAGWQIRRWVDKGVEGLPAATSLSKLLLPSAAR